MSGSVKTAFDPRRVLLGVAAVGLAASLVLEFTHYQAYKAPNASSYCTVGEKLDCTSVALSSFSVMLGVPLSLWGVAGFVALLVAAWLRSRWLVPLATLAAIASLALLGISLFAIGSVCLVCEVVHLAAIVLAVLAYRWRSSLNGAYGQRQHWPLIFALPAGLMLSFALFVPRYWHIFNWRSPITLPTGQTAEGYAWIGAETPKLTVHEFIDYRCPHCARASNYMLGMVGKHPESLRVVRRQHPGMRCRRQHERICLLPRLAYCAGEQGKFWQMDRWLFAHARGESLVQRSARDVGLDEAKLDACVKRPSTYERADREAQFAIEHVKNTPRYMIGDKTVPIDELPRLMDDL